MTREAAPSPEPRTTRGNSIVSKNNQRPEKTSLNLDKPLSQTLLNSSCTTVRNEDEDYNASLLVTEEDRRFQFYLERLLNDQSVPRWESNFRQRPIFRFGKSLKSLFLRWCNLSSGEYPTYWWRSLLSKFKFALKRPLMPADKLEDCLTVLGVDRQFLKCCEDQARQASRGRKLLIGIDPNHSTAVHPSLEYREMLRQTLNGNVDSQHERETMRGWLHSVSASLQAGELDKDAALDQYRMILGTPEISDNDLAWRLESFGLPTAEVLGDDNSSDTILPSPVIDEHERRTIRDIASHVRAYRSDTISLGTAMWRISEALEGLETDQVILASYITNQQWFDYETAKQIWEWSCTETPTESLEASEDVGATTIERITLEAIADLFMNQYGGHVDSGLDPGLALTEFRERNDIDDFSPAQVSYLLRHVEHRRTCQDTIENGETKLELVNGTMAAPARPASAALPREIPATQTQDGNIDTPSNSSSNSSDKHAKDTAVEGSNTTALKDDAEWDGFAEGAASNPQEWDYVDLSSSPEEGLSDNLFGLVLPTKQARALGHKIGLPTDYVRTRIRSSTPRRVSVRKRRKSSIRIISRNEKRKASSTIQHGRRVRAQRENRGSTLFAEDGENQETFVRKNFLEGSLLSRAGKQLQLEPLPSSRSTEMENGLPTPISRPVNPEQALSGTENASHDGRLEDVHDAAAQPYSQSLSASGSLNQPNTFRVENRRPKTVFKYLKARILDDGIFDSANLGDRVSLTSTGHCLIHELDQATRRGEVEQLRSDKDLEAMILLALVAKTPAHLSIAALLSALSVDESKALSITPDHSVFQEGTPAHTLLSCFHDSASSSRDLSASSSQSFDSCTTRPSLDLSAASSTPGRAMILGSNCWVNRSPRLRPPIWKLESLLLPSTWSTLRSSSRMLPLSASVSPGDGHVRDTISAKGSRQHDSPTSTGALPHSDVPQESFAPSHNWETLSIPLGLYSPFAYAYQECRISESSLAVHEPGKPYHMQDQDNLRSSPPLLELSKSFCQPPLDECSDSTIRTSVEYPERDSTEPDPSESPTSDPEKEPSKRDYQFHIITVEDMAKLATQERQSSPVMLETQRSPRRLANASVIDDSYFQNTSAPSPTSSTNALQRLFDKYRGDFWLSCVD